MFSPKFESTSRRRIRSRTRHLPGNDRKYGLRWHEFGTAETCGIYVAMCFVLCDGSTEGWTGKAFQCLSWMYMSACCTNN
ncbi:hypothetical protein BDN71DRAFT_1444929 [Pleurotus eryngii]|uniref:Uncharacterized protein n=1 Tax=Pleurotus eryngii TaxID=5323 RepID=A0A9P6A017_PLEER|nr:hypothetical protein BDN71DRAFT_1444929 [Pleurotus eryngii]